MVGAMRCRYDADHALVLCRLHGFREGLVFIYDKLRLHREVLQVRELSEFGGCRNNEEIEAMICSGLGQFTEGSPYVCANVVSLPGPHGGGGSCSAHYGDCSVRRRSKGVKGEDLLTACMVPHPGDIAPYHG